MAGGRTFSALAGLLKPCLLKEERAAGIRGWFTQNAGGVPRPHHHPHPHHRQGNQRLR